MGGIARGRLNDLIRFERKSRPAGLGQAGKETWAEVATVWAEVQDVLPSKSERLTEGMTMAARPARITMDWRDDITSDLRIVFGARVMQITAGPATIGLRSGIELMAQEYSTAGGGA